MLSLSRFEVIHHICGSDHRPVRGFFSLSVLQSHVPLSGITWASPVLESKLRRLSEASHDGEHETNLSGHFHQDSSEWNLHRNTQDFSHGNFEERKDAHTSGKPPPELPRYIDSTSRSTTVSLLNVSPKHSGQETPNLSISMRKQLSLHGAALLLRAWSN